MVLFTGASIEEFIESKHVSAYVKEAQKTEIGKKKSKLITGVFSEMYALHPITNKRFQFGFLTMLIDYGIIIMAVPWVIKEIGHLHKLDLEIGVNILKELIFPNLLMKKKK